MPWKECSVMDERLQFVCSNRSIIRSVQNCYLCLRYVLLPMSPERTLKQMVGERGFEPPTPWSRTRFYRLLNPIEFCRPQEIDVERVAVRQCSIVDLY